MEMQIVKLTPKADAVEIGEHVTYGVTRMLANKSDGVVHCVAKEIDPVGGVDRSLEFDLNPQSGYAYRVKQEGDMYGIYAYTFSENVEVQWADMDD